MSNKKQQKGPSEIERRPYKNMEMAELLREMRHWAAPVYGHSPIFKDLDEEWRYRRRYLTAVEMAEAQKQADANNQGEPEVVEQPDADKNRKAREAYGH